jgi:adenylate cyclase
VHAGRVVAGNIGSPDRVKYGVVGPPVNLTARIESLTVGPQTLLSADILARVAEIARVGPPTPANLKGIPDPVLVFELRGVAGAEDAVEAGTPQAEAAVDLPATFHPVDAKRVDDQARPGRVRRLSLTRVELEAPAELVDDVFDLKLVIDFGDDSPGGGSYARLAARRPAAGAVRVDAVFTALDDRDARRISALVAAVPSSAPGWASPSPS